MRGSTPHSCLRGSSRVTAAAPFPQEWLVPKEMLPPGLPLTKPPPVPAMVPPPPPFPASLDNKGPYAGQGQDYSPPAPTYGLPRPPPAALPRWIPWTAYYVPDAAK
jgi:hypothetical protein